MMIHPFKEKESHLCFSLLLMIQEAFKDSVDQDKTAQNMQSDL